MGRFHMTKYISRLMAVLLALTLLVSLSPVVYADGESGTCGEGLNWSLSAGTLTITGSGAMKNYPESQMAPWYPHRQEIVRLVLPDGLTSIGDLAFYDCDNLIAVSIPASVKTIGAYAFAECSAMEMLALGNVSSVGENAFSDCISLKALRLPDSLETIGTKAFYRCESISTVSIPASVTKLGESAFGYCTMMVSAKVYASIDKIPSLLFYGCNILSVVTIDGTADQIGEFAFRGCDSLTSVYYNGTTMSEDRVREMISTDVSSFENYGYVAQGTPSDTASVGAFQENKDGTLTQHNTSVSAGDHTTVSANVSTTMEISQKDETISGESIVNIDVTVDDADGWNEAAQKVTDTLNKLHSNLGGNNAITQQVQVNVYAQGMEQMDPVFVNALAGRDILLTVTTANGSVWRIPCKEMPRENTNAYDLSYELTAGSAELSKKLETNESFILRFLSAAEVNAEVMISLGVSRTGQTATLFQQGGSLKKIQTVVVDHDGYAHFYLASVDETTEYYIAMNLPGEDKIVPEELLNSYGNPIRTSPLEYEITGRKSSWNMSLNQVTWIMVGAFVFCIVTVGIVMFMLNKRKLQMGYVPDLEEDEE